MPATLGDVQHELNIRPQASLIVQVKNPENPEPQRNMPSNFPGFAGLGEGHRPEYPEELMVGFENLKSDKHKRYSSNEDLPRMMEIEGTELLLIGADYDVVNELHGTSKSARDRGTWDCNGADQWGMARILPHLRLRVLGRAIDVQSRPRKSKRSQPRRRARWTRRTIPSARSPRTCPASSRCMRLWTPPRAAPGCSTLPNRAS